MARPHRIPWFVLFVSLVITGAGTLLLADSVHEQDQERLDNAIQSTRTRIEARLETYMALLRGGAGLFAASDDPVDFSDFRQYASMLRIRDRYPGIQGVGYSDRIEAGRYDSLVSAMRRQGFPSFKVWPVESEYERHAIIYLEPQDTRNRAAIGFDMFSHPTRHEAMQRAMDTGLPAMSGKVTLVQEIVGRVQAGFLIYYPVYRGGAVPASVAERRAKLEGFIYAPFRADDFFADMFGKGERSRVAFRIYDGLKPEPALLMHDSSINRILAENPWDYSTRDTLRIGGRIWTITYAPTPVFRLESRNGFVIGFTLIGIMLSLTLFALSRSQLRAETAAREQAARIASEAREERLRFRAAELERSNRELREFTYIASHDLQEPLRKISTFADLLLMDFGTQLNEEGRFYLRRIKLAGLNLSKLLRDLLEYSIIQAQARPFERVDLNRIVAEVVQELEPVKQATGGSIDVEPLPEIEADPAQIRQLFGHLLRNALKFHRADERPHVKISGWLISSNGSSQKPVPKECRLEILDNGIGFEEKYLDRIFTPLQRLHEKDVYEGTGMGLAVCRRIVERHGGTITARSVPGAGSKFIISFPFEPKETPVLS